MKLLICFYTLVFLGFFFSCAFCHVFSFNKDSVTDKRKNMAKHMMADTSKYTRENSIESMVILSTNYTKDICQLVIDISTWHTSV